MNLVLESRRARRHLSLLGLIALISLTTPLPASQRAIPLDHMCKKAEHIVVGTVIDIAYVRDHWPGVGTIPFTDVTIAVEQQWKGKVVGEKLVVRVPGGRNPDGSGMKVSETPTFRLQEKVLVFSATFLGRQWVYGWEQGKYTVVVQRVVGHKGFPISKDILTHPLQRRIEALTRKGRAGKDREG